uniref:Uncharacterized protein n=2 Tax=Quercus lobata TaxID=97700 RepID=A0A7N2MP01_QUELO
MGRIWPGLPTTAGYLTPKDGGFHLYSGEVLFEVSKRWSGRVWGRQGRCFDEDTSKGSCQTSDYAGLFHCQCIGGVPPVTILEMTFGTSKSNLHYYDVSLVDGFNLPVSMVPIGGEYHACRL